MKKKRLTALVSLLLALGLPLGWSSSASASYIDCTSGTQRSFCTWTVLNANSPTHVRWTGPTNVCKSLGPSDNNTFRSLYNNLPSGQKVIVYKISGCQAYGGSALIGNGDAGNVSLLAGASFDRNISSFMFIP